MFSPAVVWILVLGLSEIRVGVDVPVFERPPTSGLLVFVYESPVNGVITSK